MTEKVLLVLSPTVYGFLAPSFTQTHTVSRQKGIAAKEEAFL